MWLASKVSDRMAAPVGEVAKAMVRAAQRGPEELKREGLGQEPGSGFKVEEGKGKEGLVVVQNPAVLKLAKELA